MNNSRLTIHATIAAISQLAAEGQHRRQVAGSLSFACTDGSLNKTVLKLAAEGVAARVVAAQLPFFVTPAQLLGGLTRLGIPAEAATNAVDAIAATNAVKVPEEQPSDRGSATILISHLVGVPSLAGIKNIQPTADVALDAPPAELIDAVTLPPAHENPVTEGDYPFMPTPAAAGEEV
jgi:hypothetical protein